MSATALVVAYHKASALDRLLASLTAPVCVVNVEADPSVARTARDRGAVVVDLDGNPGFAAAVNVGVRHVDADVVVVMNDDVVVNQVAFDTLVAAVVDGTDVAGPAHRDAHGAAESTVIGLPNPGQVALTTLLPDHPLPGLWWLPVAKWSRPKAPTVVSALTGAVLAVRTALLREFPMPESYFMYWEEVEWFWDLHRAGATVEIRPDVEIVHDGGRLSISRVKSALLARNAVRCVRLTHGRLAALSVWPAIVLGNLRLVLFDALRLTGRERVGARWAGLTAALGAWREI